MDKSMTTNHTANTGHSTGNDKVHSISATKTSISSASSSGKSFMNVPNSSFNLSNTTYNDLNKNTPQAQVHLQSQYQQSATSASAVPTVPPIPPKHRIKNSYSPVVATAVPNTVDSKMHSPLNRTEGSSAAIPKSNVPNPNASLHGNQHIPYIPQQQQHQHPPPLHQQQQPQLPHGQSGSSQPPISIPNSRQKLEKLPPGTILTVGKHKVSIVNYLSEGGFAQIYVVKLQPSEEGSDVACLKRVIVPNKEGLNQLRAEVEVMQRLAKCDNIVKYYDSNASRMTSQPGCYEVLVLMELCPNKSLLDYMNNKLRTKLNISEILKIMLDISKAVYNMHQMKLIHRDIKIENVLIDEKFNFKLADFGSTCPVLRVPRNQQEFQILHNDILMQTTPQYRCPEMIDLYRGLPIDEKSDIWALGVFLYKLCYYTTPFEVPGELGILHAAYKFPSQPVFSKELKSLINIMLQENPMYRPNIYQVLVEVCELAGLSEEVEGYHDIYGQGKYVYPLQEQIHPAIEPFTPSVVPMFSPFKGLPRDPLELQMEMKWRAAQAAQAQTQVPSQTPVHAQSQSSFHPQQPAVPHGTSVHSSPPTSFAAPSLHVPSISGGSFTPPSATTVGLSDRKELTRSNPSAATSTVSLDDLDPFAKTNSGKIEVRDENVNTDNEYAPIDVHSSFENNASDYDIDDVSSRYPEVSLNGNVKSTVSLHASVRSAKSGGNAIDEEDFIVENKSGTSLKPRTSTSTSMRKRYSMNNPFPVEEEMQLRTPVKGEDTGGSLISFDDIKDELIDIEQHK